MQERPLLISDIPLGTTDWSTVERTVHQGTTGLAYWKTRQIGLTLVGSARKPAYFADPTSTGAL